MTTRRRTFVVLPAADKRFRCSRCRRLILKGERTTVIVEAPDRVTYTHAGRACPKLYNPRPL